MLRSPLALKPRLSQAFMQHLFVGLTPLGARGCLLFKHILGPTRRGGMRRRVGVLPMNLFCIASSSAWWASSACMAAEHSRASMVRIRCSPQPVEAQRNTHFEARTVRPLHCFAREHVFWFARGALWRGGERYRGEEFQRFILGMQIVDSFINR